MKIRFYTGILLISIITVSYYFKFDYFLILNIFVFSIYDLRTSKILNKNDLILYIFFTFFMIFLFLFSKVNYKYSLIFFVLFFISIIYRKYLKLCFLLLVSNFIVHLLLLSLNDRSLLYYLIFIAFFNDTMAYIFGRLIKGPLIIPLISPNKTWSGTFISTFMSFVILFYLNFSFILSVLCAISFFLSDIYYSFIKRKYLLKDFSNLLPGHGGVLDRFDSLLIPIYFFILHSYS